MVFFMVMRAGTSTRMEQWKVSGSIIQFSQTNERKTQFVWWLWRFFQPQCPVAAYFRKSGCTVENRSDVRSHHVSTTKQPSTCKWLLLCRDCSCDRDELVRLCCNGRAKHLVPHTSWAWSRCCSCILRLLGWGGTSAFGPPGLIPVGLGPALPGIRITGG